MLTIQRMSLIGSSPTWAAIAARNACGLDPKPCTPTVLPLRSAMLRTPSRPNSSKQPAWTPAVTVIGVPASIGMMRGAAKFRLKSTLPLAIASA